MGEREAGCAVDFEGGVALGRVLPTGAGRRWQAACQGERPGRAEASPGEAPGHAGNVLPAPNARWRFEQHAVIIWFMIRESVLSRHFAVSQMHGRPDIFLMSGPVSDQ